MTEVTEGAVQALLDAGTDLANLSVVTEGEQLVGAFGTLPEGHSIKFFDLVAAREKHRAHPSRKKGIVTVADQRSFVSYWRKHAPPSAEVYADVESGTITAVLDAHGADEAGWAEHRCVLKLRTAPSWTRWINLNDRLLTQQLFAEHIEKSRTEILAPDGATLLEIAQTMHATGSAKFESGVQLHSGQRRFTYAETITARAGQTGQLDVPEMFRVLLQPWVAGPATEADALLRYRIDPSGLQLGYVISPDPVELKESVFEDLVREIEDDLNGRPRTAPGEERPEPGENDITVHRGRYFDTSDRRY